MNQSDAKGQGQAQGQGQGQLQGQAAGQVVGQAVGLTVGQAAGQATGQSVGQATVQVVGQPVGQSAGQTAGLATTQATRQPKALSTAEKPFRLAKYFSSVAVIIIFATCLVLAALMSDRAEKIIYDRVVEDTIMVMDNLRFQMYTNFLQPIYRARGEANLSQPEPYEFLNQVIQRTIHGIDITKVALYDAQFGMMVYSSDSAVPVVVYETNPQTGQQTPVGQLAEPMDTYFEAIRLALLPSNDSSLNLTSEEPPSFWQPPGSPGREAYLNRLKEQTVIVRQDGGYLFGSFFPRGQFTISCFKALEDYFTSNVSGVLVLTRDLTAEYTQIARMQYMALGIAVATSLFLSFVLWMVVARGENIINLKNAEKATLNERLNQAERLANLGQMVATVSHEIRNPLGIIRSSADFLASSLKDSPKQKKLAGAIVDESERLWRILTDFLDFARPQEPKFAPVVVEDILEEILVLLEADMSRFGVELRSQLNGDPGPVFADGALLHRAFLNLLVNAIQAMPDGGLLTVSTYVEKAGEPSGKLVIVITDTGPGLSPEAQRDLFKPFRTTKTKGTGLGLVLVRNVIESHLGKLELANIHGGEEDHGLKAVITLPLKQPDQEDAPGPE
ncbi:MAG: hypothetical protein LBT62_07735 [Deltaproteobacteria bacterium]|nr:hypothetical protein [Deltaproteobacteria bacterium]